MQELGGYGVQSDSTGGSTRTSKYQDGVQGTLTHSHTQHSIQARRERRKYSVMCSQHASPWARRKDDKVRGSEKVQRKYLLLDIPKKNGPVLQLRYLHTHV